MTDKNQATDTSVEPKFDPRRFEQKLTPEDREGRDQMGTDGPMSHVPPPNPRKRTAKPG